MSDMENALVELVRSVQDKERGRVDRIHERLVNVREVYIKSNAETAALHARIRDLEKERDEAQANTKRILWLYKPFIDSGERCTFDGREWAQCLCGWQEEVGATRCGNEAHQGNVQRAFENQIEKSGRERDAALARAATAEHQVEHWKKAAIEIADAAKIERDTRDARAAAAERSAAEAKASGFREGVEAAQRHLNNGADMLSSHRVRDGFKSAANYLDDLLPAPKEES